MTAEERAKEMKVVLPVAGDYVRLPSGQTRNFYLPAIDLSYETGNPR